MRIDRIYRFGLFIIVTVVVSFIAMSSVRKVLNNTVSKKVIENIMNVEEVTEEDVDKILGVLSDEEKKTLTTIVSNHTSSILNSEGIKEITKTRDVDKLKQQIKLELSEEEINELKQIYNNHKGEIKSIITS